MLKRFISLVATAAMLLSFAACHNKKVNNPIAQVDSKQPDKVLFDRAMDAMKHNKFDVARLTLQTLINTYPDSEFVARAKLAVGDSWYAEGGSAALTQAENEYKDFITFFPNMPEAAEAQLKIANIHYQAMEKPDRDFTHAKRAEEEYRTLLTTWPDSKLVPEAKQRLRNVQEVLAEREFRIGRFYFLRENYAASEARLKWLVDTYPLYSGADEALYMLGETYERRADALRGMSQLAENVRGSLIRKTDDEAAAAYARIITRYPEMNRAGDAKARLEALHRPVPTPTREAIAQNKAEQESREKLGMWGNIMSNVHRGPDAVIAQSSKVGEPPLTDPAQTSAPEITRKAQQELVNAVMQANGQNSGKVSIEKINGAGPGPNQPAPRSDTQPASGENNSGIPELQPVPDASQTEPQPAITTPPAQVNEVDAQKAAQQSATSSSSTESSSSNASADTSKTDSKTDSNDKSESTSKKKKKSGIRKIVPF